jgi:hypothetical protein
MAASPKRFRNRGTAQAGAKLISRRQKTKKPSAERGWLFGYETNFKRLLFLGFFRFLFFFSAFALIAHFVYPPFTFINATILSPIDPPAKLFLSAMRRQLAYHGDSTV